MHKMSTFPRSTLSSRGFAMLVRALAVLLSLGFGAGAQAHTPLFDCFDNGDDTLTCEGGFSDGSSAAGVSIRVLDRQGTHELFAAKRTYHSQIADAVVPEKPLTVGPGYHLNPEAEENQGG